MNRKIVRYKSLKYLHLHKIYTHLHLALDIGNSNTKLGLFHGEEMVGFSYLNIKDFKNYLQNNLVTCCTFSITGSDNKGLIDIISSLEIPFQIARYDKIPLDLQHYKTIETLGMDRVLACIGARSIDAENDMMVITAGTCITYNFLTDQNKFQGGAISPGIQMRFDAMHHFTSRLPQLELQNQNPILVGDSTTTSMESGAIIGAISEIEGVIMKYITEFPKIKVFLTGGNTEFLKTKIINKIFADEHLVLKGLNAISRYYE
jgi:type III pantothenate kinase